MSAKSTHWSAYSEPAYWPENPVPSPSAAVEQMLADHDGDEGWELAHALRHGPQDVVLFGHVEIDQTLPEDSRFEGYQPGLTYFKATGEKLSVRVSLAFEVKP